MRGAERPPGDEPLRARHAGRHRVDLGRGERLGLVERRQDPRQALREHRLAGAGRPEEEQVVAARGRDLERALGVLLAGDVGEVEAAALVGGEGAPTASGGLGERPLAAQVADGVGEGGGGIQARAAHHRGLGEVVGGQDHGGAAAGRGLDDREHAAHRAQRAVERELADQPRLRRAGGRQAGGHQHPGGDRQVEERALLALLGGGEVDDDALRLDLTPEVADRRQDPLAGLAHRRVGEADDGQVGEPGAGRTPRPGRAAPRRRAEQPTTPWQPWVHLRSGGGRTVADSLGPDPAAVKVSLAGGRPQGRDRRSEAPPGGRAGAPDEASLGVLAAARRGARRAARARLARREALNREERLAGGGEAGRPRRRRGMAAEGSETEQQREDERRAAPPPTTRPASLSTQPRWSALIPRRRPFPARKTSRAASTATAAIASIRPPPLAAGAADELGRGRACPAAGGDRGDDRGDERREAHRPRDQPEDGAAAHHEEDDEVHGGNLNAGRAVH